MGRSPTPFLVGDRLNATGSRTFKGLLLAGDSNGIVGLARRQIDAGARALDVSVALPDQTGEAERMEWVVRLLSTKTGVPLMIDSTDPDVIGRALPHLRPDSIVNSIGLQHGRARLDAVVRLAQGHRAALVALCIDESGMATTRDRKLNAARAIHDIIVGEHGMPANAIAYDPLVFPLGRGDPGTAVDTIEGIRAIKASLAGTLTVLAVSNVSFGMPPTARVVLDSVFLHHCVEAGLDAALVNPMGLKRYAEIPGEERHLADDLVFNRRPDARQRFLAGRPES